MIVNKLLTSDEISLYRLALGMSQRDLAKELFVTCQTVCNVECGKMTKANSQYFTMALTQLWNDIPKEEKPWRLKVAKMGINAKNVNKEEASRIFSLNTADINNLAYIIKNWT